jgi:hypothetical protein
MKVTEFIFCISGISAPVEQPFSVINYICFYTGKHLSDKFPIQNSQKQGDALSPLLFNFASEYAIMKVQKNRCN